MKKPNKELKTLVKLKKYTDSKFKRYVSQLKREAKKMKSYKHKEQDFNDMNKDMMTSLEDLEKAIKEKDVDMIKESWEAVAESCQNCHYKYNKD